MSALAPNYKRKNLSFVRGKGSFLITADGKKYLDFVQGIAVNSLGHTNQKLVNAINKHLDSGSNEELTEESFDEFLSTSKFTDPDLCIRTGNELRISNFLLWQLAYSELYFPDVLWPDFDDQHFDNALKEYSKRSRRFGDKSNFQL